MSDEQFAPAVGRAVAALQGLATALGQDPDRATSGIRGPVTALEALEAAERRLAGPEPGPAVAVRLLEVRSARADLLTLRLARQRSLLDRVNQTLAAMRTAQSVDDLADSVPMHATSLGYDRALFSWVHQERWIPRSAHVRSAVQSARRMLDAGRPPYHHVRNLLEVEIVRGRRPILVHDCMDNPRVHPRLQEVNQTTSYTAAPVVAGGRVAGFVHLDRNLDTDVIDEFDRDLLASFCSGVGLLVDQLQLTRPSGPSGSDRAAAGWLDTLTEREHEVLRLLAAGLTNAQIGSRLFISEETTKTHVKRLLRKVGAANRVQAGAMYHRALTG